MEVLFSHEKERIRRPEDAVVCCLHSYMTVNGYKCIGGGEKVNNAVFQWFGTEPVSLKGQIFRIGTVHHAEGL